LAVVVLVVVAIHLVLGWFLANGLRETALRIQPPTQGAGFAVRAVSSNEIVLEAASPRQEIGHPGVIGLIWDDGYGQIADVIHVEDNRVRRGFQLIQGDLPASCPDLPVDECPQVFPDGYAFPAGPDDVDLAFEEVNYSSPLGEMGAWVVPSSSEWWAIHVHGWTASRREAVRLLPSINKLGMTSLVIDYRNDPGAPTDPSGHYRFGLHEWEDVEAAVSYAIESGALHIVCVGYSTGAAHILSFLEESRLADRVDALVLDSPNVILAETIRHGSRAARFPGLGFRASPLLIELGMWIADLRWGIDWDRTNYVQRAKSILHVPTLVFHGTSDARVPISISRQLETRVPDLVQLEETPAAGHVMSWNADPGRYERLLESFLSQIQN
jgi:pimeloyl-ACP methyl ester carboxylesterase